MTTKTITFHRADRDFTAELDGAYIGSFASHHDAEVALDQAVYERLAHDGPSPVEAAVEGALERLAGEHQRSFERAEGKSERAFFTRWAGAFRKALLYYHQGARPEPLASGAWLVTSATRGGVVHQVGRDNHCTCESRDKGCWHAALCLGIEVAGDDMDRFDGGDAELPAKPAPDGGPGDAKEEEEPAALRVSSRAFAGDRPIVGAYIRSAVLDTMLDRSAATIAAMADADRGPYATPGLTCCRPDDPCSPDDPCPAHEARARAWLLARAALIADELYGKAA